jgi:hypothetical protein
VNERGRLAYDLLPIRENRELREVGRSRPGHVASANDCIFTECRDLGMEIGTRPHLHTTAK